MNPSLNVVILAAGQGTRMVSDLPKVMHLLGGKPLLAHVLDAAVRLQPRKICVVFGHGGEMVRNHFAASAVTWVEQERQQGTGHAVMQALPHLEDDSATLVLCGDVPLIQPGTLSRLVAEADGGIGVLTIEVETPAGYGRIVKERGRVTRIVEEKDANGEERKIKEINTGVIVAPTGKLKQWLSALTPSNKQGEYYLTDIIARAASDGMKVTTSTADNVWEITGVNTRAQLAQLETIRRNLVATRLLEQGVGIADPARLDVRGSLTCGRDCQIDIDCIFEGEVVLGDRVHIGPYSVLKNVQVGAGTQIEAYCHLNEADIGRDCRIGPYARLRPAARLANDVHIGNFVEVKASDIGAGSKANHLSYIGDSEVGKNVNVGAGTITCNYDGVNKHRTIIEDDVFIGSDTQLVAPIRVGRGATLGAGTTLTRDAPAEKLTLSRAKQVTSTKWSRPTRRK